MYTAVQAVWKVTYRVTARWSKRQNLAIVAGERVTLCVVSSVRVYGFVFVSSCETLSRYYLGIYLSRVIAPNLRAAALEEDQVVVVLARNAIAVERLVTLRVHAPRRPEAVQEAEAAMAGEVGEATVVLGVGAGVEAVKKHGGCRVLSCRLRGVNIFEVTLAVE